MRILVACEFSGRVRDAFIAKGHDAISCDLLPTESPGPHYQGDVFRFIAEMGEFDMMIAHPPCTYLANSGVRWLYEQGNRKGDRSVNSVRWGMMVEGAEFFKRLMNLPIERICVENPIMHSYAREIVGRRADQTIQPWMFGHPEQKATCLWLKGLSPLTPTNDVRLEMVGMTEGQAQPMFYASPGPDRWKVRSTTYLGIAAAMAEQWG